MASKAIKDLHQFSLSVDIIDDRIYENIKNRISQYIQDSLQASFFEILVDGVRINNGNGYQSGLETVWTNRKKVNISVFCENNTYVGQTTYAYHNDKPLWIVTGNKGNLVDSNSIDLWSKSENLPKYKDYGDSDSKTSIIIPLRYGDRVYGFLNLEFEEYYECTKAGKSEVETLADSISRIIWLYKTSKNQLQDTHTAFRSFEADLRNNQKPLKKPHVFLATASNADPEVIGCIRTVLDKFSEYIDVIYWKNISTSGNINEQILNAIANSEWGICYLSEFTGNQKPKYQDNTNVVFEAGMMQALNNSPDSKPTGWIPIRESVELSSSIPFDFAAERILEVPRNSKENMNEEAFINKLKNAIEQLISI